MHIPLFCVLRPFIHNCSALVLDAQHSVLAWHLEHPTRLHLGIRTTDPERMKRRTSTLRYSVNLGDRERACEVRPSKLTRLNGCMVMSNKLQRFASLGELRRTIMRPSICSSEDVLRLILIAIHTYAYFRRSLSYDTYQTCTSVDELLVLRCIGLGMVMPLVSLALRGSRPHI